MVGFQRKIKKAKRYLSRDQRPHEADHCSAGAGSTGQSKQHAGSGAGWWALHERLSHACGLATVTKLRARVPRDHEHGYRRLWTQGAPVVLRGGSVGAIFIAKLASREESPILRGSRLSMVCVGLLVFVLFPAASEGTRKVNQLGAAAVKAGIKPCGPKRGDRPCCGDGKCDAPEVSRPASPNPAQDEGRSRWQLTLALTLPRTR